MTVASVVILGEGTTPATPATGKDGLFFDTSSVLKAIDDAGTVTTVLTSGTAAGGDLTGTYPNPTVAALAITAAKIAALTITDAQVAAANKDGAAGTASMRTLSTTSTTACAGDDARLSDARAPSGAASGDLGGTYPSPTVAAITTTSGPTSLVVGTITDGEFLKRVGSTLVSGTPAGGSGISMGILVASQSGITMP